MTKDIHKWFYHKKPICSREHLNLHLHIHKLTQNNLLDVSIITYLYIYLTINNYIFTVDGKYSMYVFSLLNVCMCVRGSYVNLYCIKRH